MLSSGCRWVQQLSANTVCSPLHHDTQTTAQTIPEKYLKHANEGPGLSVTWPHSLICQKRVHRRKAIPKHVCVDESMLIKGPGSHAAKCPHSNFAKNNAQLLVSFHHSQGRRGRLYSMLSKHYYNTQKKLPRPCWVRGLDHCSRS